MFYDVTYQGAIDAAVSRLAVTPFTSVEFVSKQTGEAKDYPISSRYLFPSDYAEMAEHYDITFKGVKRPTNRMRPVGQAKLTSAVDSSYIVPQAEINARQVASIAAKMADERVKKYEQKLSQMLATKATAETVVETESEPKAEEAPTENVAADEAESQTE